MRHPRIKTTHSPVRLTRTLISIGGVQHDVGAELADDLDGTMWRLIELMDGERTEADIVEQLVRERPRIDSGSVTMAIRDLAAAGFVEDAEGPLPANLSPLEAERYERAANYFGWVDLTPRYSRFELQSRLKTKRVVICGLGGAGSAVAAALTAAGVGAIHCVDFDRIEKSNLSRQLLYTEDDVGAAKVDTAVGRLRRLNGFVAVSGESARVLGTADIARLMHSADLFVLCADTPRDRIQRWANEAAFATGTAWQMALYAGPMLVTGLWVPGVTRCFACVPTSEEVFARVHGAPPLGMIGDGPSHAVLAPTANITGHVAALEAIYYLTGLTPTSLGRMFHLSFTDLSHRYFVEPRADATCEVCGASAASDAD